MVPIFKFCLGSLKTALHYSNQPVLSPDIMSRKIASQKDVLYVRVFILCLTAKYKKKTWKRKHPTIFASNQRYNDKNMFLIGLVFWGTIKEESCHKMILFLPDKFFKSPNRKITVVITERSRGFIEITRSAVACGTTNRFVASVWRSILLK
jgi:hypothetical protein